MAKKKKAVAERNKFLVFIDDREHSRVALRLACKKAKTNGQRLMLLYVINPHQYNSLFAMGDVMKKERREDVEKLLQSMAEEAHAWCEDVPAIHIREGTPASEIIACIEEDVDISMLILSSTPAASAGGQKLLATLTAALDEKLHIPAMIVPAHLTDQQIEALG